MADSRLFKPVKLGNIELKHRIALAPLTRFKADDNHVHGDLAVEYYSQRASVPGTLLITEATFISPSAGGYANVPGIWNQAQIDAWKRVTDAVHAKGSFIYLQLWHLGRTADPEVAKKEGITIRSASAIGLEGHAVPEEMTVDDIKQAIADFAQAAKNSIAAGFDGVEVHAANGYLPDQFNQSNSNHRTDEYGGSIENRSRFTYEITKAVVEAVGAERTGIRLSPFSEFQGMRMKDPYPQFGDLIKRLNEFPLSYIHLVESRISGNADVDSTDRIEPLLDLWKHSPVLAAGGFKPDSARRLVDEEDTHRDLIVVFGRYFISNPDLPFRIKNNIELQQYDRETFYVPKSSKGYTDQPFSKEFLASEGKA